MGLQTKKHHQTSIRLNLLTWGGGVHTGRHLFNDLSHFGVWGGTPTSSREGGCLKNALF